MVLSPQDGLLALTVAMLDGLLSVDNALANAAQARSLPLPQQRTAISLGVAAGAVFRLAALFAVAWILRFPVLKLAGAAWLLWLVIRHFFLRKDDVDGVGTHSRQFWRVVGAICLTDLAFSIDNVIAAVAISPSLLVVSLGVIASVLVMLVATQGMSLLMRRYRLLEDAAYVIILFISMGIFAADLHRLLPAVGSYELPALGKFGFSVLIIFLTILWEEVVLRTKKAPR